MEEGRVEVKGGVCKRRRVAPRADRRPGLKDVEEVSGVE